MAFEKITDSELESVGVELLDDVPGLSPGAMKAKFEETAKKLLAPKINKLIDALDDIFARFGVYAARVKGYTFEGTDGMEKMANIMKKLRSNPPTSFAGYEVLSCADYQTSIRKDFRTGGETKIDLPTSNVLEYNLENNLKVIIRPSGTEPKIKVYLTIVTNDKPQIDLIAENLFHSAQGLMA